MILPLKFKIISEFQKNNFYQGNIAVKWNLENANTLDNLDKFHFFRYIDMDLTWDFEKNKRYIFPIFIDNVIVSIEETNLFLKSIRDFINENKTLFLDKILIPVFLDPLEGNFHVGELINTISNELQDIKFYHISADYNLQLTDNKFNFFYIDQWKHHVSPKETIIDYVPKKDYINLNRMPRFHRCLLMQKIIDNLLLDKGYNTWARSNSSNSSIYSNNYFDQFKNHYPNNTIENQKYDILDVNDIEVENPTYKIPIDHCRESFIYIVTETHIGKESFFLSEKSYKPISIGMPFMILGNPGSLQHLREKGYATFSDWIDESYDLDLPLEERINIIVQNLIKISKMYDIEKINIRRQMNEICEHNLNLYKLLNRKNSLIETLKLIEKGML